MTGGPHFIDRKVFERTIAEVERRDGGTYEDVATIYGDMSRLVVAWLANTGDDELRRLYNNLGWQGSANIRAIQQAAQKWMREYRPEGLKGAK